MQVGVLTQRQVVHSVLDLAEDVGQSGRAVRARLDGTDVYLQLLLDHHQIFNLERTQYVYL